MSKRALTDARISLASLPLLAQGLAGASGVKVVFSKQARTASTDGRRITMPVLPLPTSEDDVEAATRLKVLVHGFIAHEVGHVRETQFECFVTDRTERGDLTVSLLNAIEDPRQEVEFIRSFPGSRGQLDEMLEALIGPQGFYDVLTESDTPAWLLTAYTLYLARSLLRDQAPFEELAERSQAAMLAVFGEGVVSRLEVIMSSQAPKLRNTADALQLAKYIVAAVEEEAKKDPPQGNPSDSSESGDGDGADGQGKSESEGSGDSSAGKAGGSDADDADDDDTGDGDGEGGGGGDADGDKPDADAGAGEGDGGEGSDNADSKSDQSSSNASGGGSGNSDSQSIRDAVKSAIENAADNGLKDLGDMAKKAISDQIDDIQANGADGQVGDSEEAVRNMDVNGTPMRPTTSGSFDDTSALQQSGRIRQMLQSELQALQRRRDHEATRGTVLNQRRLHRTSSGDRRLFLRMDERKALNTAVFVLCDNSSSMDGNPMQLASEACFSTAVALNALKGVVTAVGTFPGYGLALRFGERAGVAKEHFGLRASGCTPMAEGVLWASRQLVARREDRKILMVVTDGQPDCVGSALAQLAAAEAMGIETMGLGIKLPMVSKLFEKHAVISSLEEIGPAMLSMIRGSLGSQLVAA